MMCEHEKKYAKGMCYSCYYKAYQAERHGQRKAQGLCLECAAPLDRNGVRCKRCCKFRNATQQAWRERNASPNLLFL